MGNPAKARLAKAAGAMGGGKYSWSWSDVPDGPWNEPTPEALERAREIVAATK